MKYENNDGNGYDNDDEVSIYSDNINIYFSRRPPFWTASLNAIRRNCAYNIIF